jgi:hypothetical protein
MKTRIPVAKMTRAGMTNSQAKTSVGTQPSGKRASTLPNPHQAAESNRERRVPSKSAATCQRLHSICRAAQLTIASDALFAHSWIAANSPAKVCSAMPAADAGWWASGTRETKMAATRSATPTTTLAWSCRDLVSVLLSSWALASPAESVNCWRTALRSRLRTCVRSGGASASSSVSAPRRRAATRRARPRSA